MGKDVVLTCEPTEQEYGKLIRKIFRSELDASPYTVAALFLADRLEHILHTEEGMLSLLSQNKTILSDRYYLSSMAYQSVETSMDWVMDINEKPRALLKPDVHIYLDLAPEAAMRRLLDRNENLEIYETTENLKKVHENYRIAIDKISGTEVIWEFGADQAPEKLSEEIWKRIQTLVNKTS